VDFGSFLQEALAFRKKDEHKNGKKRSKTQNKINEKIS